MPKYLFQEATPLVRWNGSATELRINPQLPRNEFKFNITRYSDRSVSMEGRTPSLHLKNIPSDLGSREFANIVAKVTNLCASADAALTPFDIESIFNELSFHSASIANGDPYTLMTANSAATNEFLGTIALRHTPYPGHAELVVRFRDDCWTDGSVSEAIFFMLFKVVPYLCQKGFKIANVVPMMNRQGHTLPAQFINPLTTIISNVCVNMPVQYLLQQHGFKINEQSRCYDSSGNEWNYLFMPIRDLAQILINSEPPQPSIADLSVVPASNELQVPEINPQVFAKTKVVPPRSLWAGEKSLFFNFALDNKTEQNVEIDRSITPDTERRFRTLSEELVAGLLDDISLNDKAEHDEAKSPASCLSQASSSGIKSPITSILSDASLHETESIEEKSSPNLAAFEEHKQRQRRNRGHRQKSNTEASNTPTPPRHQVSKISIFS